MRAHPSSCLGRPPILPRARAGRPAQRGHLFGRAVKGSLLRGGVFYTQRWEAAWPERPICLFSTFSTNFWQPVFAGYQRVFYSFSPRPGQRDPRTILYIRVFITWKTAGHSWYLQSGPYRRPRTRAESGAFHYKVLTCGYCRKPQLSFEPLKSAPTRRRPPRRPRWSPRPRQPRRPPPRPRPRPRPRSRPPGR